MKILEKERCFILPIEGMKLTKITYTGLLRLDFEHCFLELHGDFEITRHHQVKKISIRDKDALMISHDLFGKTITGAIAGKTGGLSLMFDDGTQISMEDDSFENWHLTIIDHNSRQNLYIHGGLGRTIIGHI